MKNIDKFIKYLRKRTGKKLPIWESSVLSSIMFSEQDSWNSKGKPFDLKTALNNALADKGKYPQILNEFNELNPQSADYPDCREIRPLDFSNDTWRMFYATLAREDREEGIIRSMAP